MTQKLPVALQLYSVRDHTAKDMAGTLRQLAAMGYQNVELAGYGNLTREQLKDVIDETAQEVVSIHTNLPRLQNEIDDIVAESKVFGSHYVVLGSVPAELRGSAANWREAAKILSDIGEKLHQNDLQLCYHNHAFEFERAGNSGSRARNQRNRGGFGRFAAAASARIQKPRLQLHRLKTASDPGQIAGWRMAGAAPARAVEKRLTGSRIAREHVLNDERLALFVAHEIGEAIANRRPRSNPSNSMGCPGPGETRRSTVCDSV